MWYLMGVEKVVPFGAISAGGLRMARSTRIQVTLSFPMTVALEVLALRNGHTPSGQAAVSLRAALARTMETEEVQKRVRAHNARRDRATWLADTVTEHAVEVGYAEDQAREARIGRSGGAAAASVQEAALAGQGPAYTVAGERVAPGT